MHQELISVCPTKTSGLNYVGHGGGHRGTRYYYTVRLRSLWLKSICWTCSASVCVFRGFYTTDIPIVQQEFLMRRFCSTRRAVEIRVEILKWYNYIFITDFPTHSLLTLKTTESLFMFSTLAAAEKTCGGIFTKWNVDIF